MAGKPTTKEIKCRVRGYRGQILTMGILAAMRQYDELITKGGLMVNPTPSWEAIDFSNDVDEMECAWHLAMWGVTIDEALDVSQLTKLRTCHNTRSPGSNTQTRPRRIRKCVSS